MTTSGAPRLPRAPVLPDRTARRFPLRRAVRPFLDTLWERSQNIPNRAWPGRTAG
ncbi:hypothetical protein BJ982_005880 [Sphaerisporangium siamense]|uniref:Uncharacterized protein n=1 Tax=Sphaerisporangium siamense TaxID=795645 RepID=A0A7W7GES5_9ACTN|nr:hypothetical protein [Sphaerisporangium siamense]